ncbi:MAG: hypothetical protein RR245_00565, partial [Clostridia bacterium]
RLPFAVCRLPFAVCRLNKKAPLEFSGVLYFINLFNVFLLYYFAVTYFFALTNYHLYCLSFYS